METTSTIPRPPDDRPGPIDRFFHYLLMATLVVVLVLAATGRLGVSTDVSTDRSGSYELSVLHATVTRPGLATPLEITVSAVDSLPPTVEVVLDGAYLDAFDANAITPQPASDFRSGELTRWTFEVPDGERTLTIALDARFDPSEQTSRSAEVSVRIDGATLLAPLETRVMP